MADNIGDRVDNPAEAGVDRYVGLEHLDRESLKIRRWGTPDEVEATKLRFKSGDIIFGKRRAYQRKLAVADFEGICSAHAMVLRAREDAIAKEFLPVFMQSDIFFDRAISISVGSLSPTINWKTLAAQEFLIPPKPEQQRIAEILWAVDKTLNSYQAVAANLKKTLAAFRHEVVCASSHPRQKFGKFLSNIVPGRSVSGVGEPAQQKEYGVLKVSAVGPKGFAPGENKRLISPADFRPEFAVRKDDFLITRCNTRELVGRVCIVDDDYTNLMLCDKTLRLEFKNQVSCAGFFLEALSSEEARRQIESCAVGTGGAMKNITQDAVRNLTLPVPERSVQLSIDKKSRLLIQEMRDVDASLQSLHSLKSALWNNITNV